MMTDVLLLVKDAAAGHRSVQRCSLQMIGFSAVPFGITAEMENSYTLLSLLRPGPGMWMHKVAVIMPSINVICP